MTDSAYLRSEQYRVSSRLRKRMGLHERYHTSQYPWFQWVYKQLELEQGCRVLEVGCGPGSLWSENFEQLPKEITLILTDLSAGMVTAASQALAGDTRFACLVANVEDLPLSLEQFDVVIANHMLYHLPDLQRGVQSIRRVVKPGGVLFAATNGLRHMYELMELIHQVEPGYHEYSVAERFGLENAAEVLAPTFSNVQVSMYTDNLWVTDTEPLIDYIRSIWVADELLPGQFERLEQIVSRRIAVDGGIHINKSSGLVKARRH